MYVLWKPGDMASEQFRDNFLQQVVASLQQAGASQLRFTVIDNAVTPAARLFIRHTQPSPDAIASFWLDSAIHRQALEQILRSCCSACHGYLVTESEALRNQQHMAPKGQRTHGMNQVVFLRRPSRLDFQTWIDLWHNSHTQIALETQSTFGYRQNVVTRTLTAGAMPIDAIVEENFPPEAMDSAHAFYKAIAADGKKDHELMKQHQTKMYQSVQRFLDFDQLDCLPMSEYNF